MTWKIECDPMCIVHFKLSLKKKNDEKKMCSTLEWYQTSNRSIKPYGWLNQKVQTSKKTKSIVYHEKYAVDMAKLKVYQL